SLNAPTPVSTHFPYTTLFRSEFLHHLDSLGIQFSTSYSLPVIKERFVRWIDEKKYWEPALTADGQQRDDAWVIDASKVLELKDRSEEHTSELQSRENLVCRLP